MGNYGKLSRLPFLISEELNSRLLDEQRPRDILAWLNADPACLKVLRDSFGGKRVTPQNLSEYKAGAKFADWKKKREALAREQDDTEFAVGLAHEAGLELGDAGDAIFMSRMISMMRNENDVETITGLMKSYASLRKGSVARGALAVRQKELEGRAKKLEQEERRMEMNTVKQFVKWAQSKEAQSIVTSGKPKTVQMDLLHDLMFGKKASGEGI